MVDLDVLKAELTADPLARGYSGMTDQQAADSLNLTIDRTVNIGSLTGDLVFQATDAAEFAALTDEKRMLWLSFCGRSEINPFGTANVAFVQFVFNGGNVTVANLANLRRRSVSRGVELGLGVVLTGQVQEARRL